MPNYRCSPGGRGVASKIFLAADPPITESCQRAQPPPAGCQLRRTSPYNPPPQVGELLPKQRRP